MSDVMVLRMISASNGFSVLCQAKTMDEVRVISSDKDGVDLRREKRKSRYYTRCDGAADNCEINEALTSLSGQSMFVRAEDWERIFGGNH